MDDDARIESDTPMDLGPCCACGKSGPSVRNIHMLPWKAREPGKGWGCVVCGLPPDGASAVYCDECHESNAPLVWAVDGYLAAHGRILIKELPHEAHEHNEALHLMEQIGQSIPGWQRPTWEDVEDL